MEEKKQKKIKASGTPANLAGYLSNFVVGRNRPLIQEKKQKKIKASTEAGEVGRVHDKSNRLPDKLGGLPVTLGWWL